jgi:hypothetical protein
MTPTGSRVLVLVAALLAGSVAVASLFLDPLRPIGQLASSVAVWERSGSCSAPATARSALHTSSGMREVAGMRSSRPTVAGREAGSPSCSRSTGPPEPRDIKTALPLEVQAGVLSWVREQREAP